MKICRTRRLVLPKSSIIRLKYVYKCFICLILMEMINVPDVETKNVEIESIPWSNNSPSGPERFSRRACLPSTASNVWTISSKSDQSALEFHLVNKKAKCTEVISPAEKGIDETARSISRSTRFTGPWIPYLVLRQ